MRGLRSSCGWLLAAGSGGQGRLGAPVARIGQPANPEPNGATRGARRANGAQTDWSMPGLCRSTQKSPTDVSLQRAGAAVNQKRTARRRH
jgi:hypothetical protein